MNRYNSRHSNRKLTNLNQVELPRFTDCQIHGQNVTPDQAIDILIYLEDTNEPECLEFLNFKWIFIDGTISYNKSPIVLPTTEMAAELFHEALNLLSAKFPYLSLTCVLYDNYESTDPNVLNLNQPHPIVKFTVNSGTATHQLGKVCQICYAGLGNNLITTNSDDQPINTSNDKPSNIKRSFYLSDDDYVCLGCMNNTAKYSSYLEGKKRDWNDKYSNHPTTNQSIDLNNHNNTSMSSPTSTPSSIAPTDDQKDQHKLNIISSSMKTCQSEIDRIAEKVEKLRSDVRESKFKLYTMDVPPKSS